MNVPVGSFNTIQEFRSPRGGVLLVDKPEGWTSFDVVKKVRGMLRVDKVGHAGTLDPLATGLLILASRQHTRRLDAFQALEKIYEGTFAVGGSTSSYDSATPVDQEYDASGVSLPVLRSGTGAFVGEIEQLPPMYSAVKVGGKRLYSLARKGATVERTPRKIVVEEFEIVRFDAMTAAFRVRCSKGTYVRSLVHDLGQQIGCGAYLTSLRRTAIGAFHVDEAWTMSALIEAAQTPEPETEVAHAGG